MEKTRHSIIKRIAFIGNYSPRQCGNEWIFSPQEPYELHGDVDKVVFPCGYTLALDGDTLRIYYGAADTSIAMATASLRDMLGWLNEQDNGLAGVQVLRRSTDGSTAKTN